MNNINSVSIIGVVFNIFTLAFACIVIYLIFKEKKALGRVTLAALLFVFCALIGNTDRFESFTFSPTGGLVAKARTVIQQAQVTIEQLQKMATAFAQANLTELAISGQILSGINTEYKFALHDQIIASLKDIKVSDAEIDKAQRPWSGVYCSMLLDNIEAKATSLLPSAEVVDQIEALPRDAERDLPSPDTLNKWINSQRLHDETITKLAFEYGNVWTTGSMKDPHLLPFNQALSGRHQP